MNILNKLQRKPRHFQAFTGLTPTQLDTLLAEFTPVYETAMNQKYQKPGRLPQPGAGRPFALETPDRLRMGLMSPRLYVSQSLLSYLFACAQSNARRELAFACRRFCATRCLQKRLLQRQAGFGFFKPPGERVAGDAEHAGNAAQGAALVIGGAYLRLPLWGGPTRLSLWTKDMTAGAAVSALFGQPARDKQAIQQVEAELRQQREYRGGNGAL